MIGTGQQCHTRATHLFLPWPFSPKVEQLEYFHHCLSLSLPMGAHICAVGERFDEHKACGINTQASQVIGKISKFCHLRLNQTHESLEFQILKPLLFYDILLLSPKATFFISCRLQWKKNYDYVGLSIHSLNTPKVKLALFRISQLDEHSEWNTYFN